MEVELKKALQQEVLAAKARWGAEVKLSKAPSNSPTAPLPIGAPSAPRRRPPAQKAVPHRSRALACGSTGGRGLKTPAGRSARDSGWRRVVCLAVAAFRKFWFAAGSSCCGYFYCRRSFVVATPEPWAAPA
eukprot:scaffold16832_cov115-Isochrysis_galbana.AAC.2